ncbi:MAG: hypothetical protein M1820_010659 [Bogoriella megaspora]|nr:MAG: hypothetical protein M1820_010659 [Bogoriella megaspora]
MDPQMIAEMPPAVQAELLANHGYRIEIAVGFSIAITCITIVLRLLARKMKRLQLGPDDYLIILGAIFTIATAVLFVPAVHNGAGRHLLTLEPNQIVSYFKIIYAAWQVYGLALTFIKLSVLFFYLRIFGTSSNRGFRIRIIIVGALAIGWLFAANAVAAFQCDPIKKYWLVLIPGKCLNPLRCVVAMHSINLGLDIIILALPVAEIWRTQMSTWKKFLVGGIFMLGGLSIVIAGIRLKVILNARFEDITWYTGIHSWTAVEPAIEVLSVSLPSMAPFLHPRKLLREFQASGYIPSGSRKQSSKASGNSTLGRSPSALDDMRKWDSSAKSTDEIPLREVELDRELRKVETPV